MKTFKITVAHEAELFLANTYDYIYLKNPAGAIKWLEGINAKIQDLTTFPNKGTVVPEAREEPLLAKLHQVFFSMNPSGNTYRIIYTIQDDTVQVVNVVTIRNSAQEPLK